MWMGPGRHLVHYFVRNKQMFNFVTAVEQDSWTGGVIDRQGRRRDRACRVRADGTPRYAPLSPLSTTCTSGHFSTARRSNDGRSGARRSSAMPAIRCCRSWPKALHKRSRTARRSRLASRAPAARTSRWHSIATSGCGYPAPHVFKRGPLPTRRASTSRTSRTRGTRRTDGDRINRLLEIRDRLDLRTRPHQARTVGRAGARGTCRCRRSDLLVGRGGARRCC